jgi:lipid-A-disaccharide synthase
LRTEKTTNLDAFFSISWGCVLLTDRSAPILLLTQGHAGDRLGARLAPALRAAFPERSLMGMGGAGMAAQGVQLIARAERISVMGYSGLLPQVPAIFQAIFRAALFARRTQPALVVAVDVWQPLQVLHRWAPHLHEAPHLCYLPPAPNFTGGSRVHGALARVFGSIVTPFPHQERLYREAGGQTRLAAHAGLQTCLEEAQPLPYAEREPILAILPGSRELEVRTGLPIQYAAAQQVVAAHPGLRPVVCCANEAIERYVRHAYPAAAVERNARQVLARAQFGLICSGTATLEAAVLGCPGVVTYSGSSLQRLEWERIHVPRLARLRAAGIASPYIALPNIIAGKELYPEVIALPAEAVAEAALRELAGNLLEKRAALDEVAHALSWEDAGRVVAEEGQRLLGVRAV